MLFRSLKQERERLGLRIADVQGRSEIDPSLISRMENDPETNPTVTTLRRYAQAFERITGTIFHFSGLEPQAETARLLSSLV